MAIQPFTAKNSRDENGAPAGGYVVGTGMTIVWQNGPLVDPDTGDRLEPSGAFVETVIDAVIQRLHEYQDTKFNCPENAEALSYLVQANDALHRRTAAREEQGVEGTHQLHES